MGSGFLTGLQASRGSQQGTATSNSFSVVACPSQASPPRPPFLPAGGQNLSFSGASHWGAASKLLLPERVHKRGQGSLFQKECSSPLLCLTDWNQVLKLGHVQNEDIAQGSGSEEETSGGHPRSYVPYSASVFFAIDHRTDTFSWGLKVVSVSFCY